MADVDRWGYKVINQVGNCRGIQWNSSIFLVKPPCRGYFILRGRDWPGHMASLQGLRLIRELPGKWNQETACDYTNKSWYT
jgi:hypothetical protein